MCHLPRLLALVALVALVIISGEQVARTYAGIATPAGSTTQGTCIAFDANENCLAAETILFPYGSTLEFQGIEGGGAPSAWTIVGGSGRYLGATGTMTEVPSAAFMLWTKTIEIAAAPGRP